MTKLLGMQNQFQADTSGYLNPVNQGQVNMANRQAQGALGSQQAFVNALAGQGGLGNQSAVFGQQQALANQLQQQAMGQGPNPALAQFQQATGQNIANQAALMANQRGASANAGLMARQAAQQGAGIQQQAVGQAGVMQANQQLAAQQALMQQQQAMGAMANQQVAQQAQGLQGLNQFAQGFQGQMLQGAQMGNQNQTAINQLNAGVAAGNQQATSGLVGGLLGGAATVMTGGSNKAAGAAHGGVIDGQAMVPGDHPVNDTVPTMLSPGEVVIPRSVMQSKDPAKAAAAFVKQVMEGEHKVTGGKLASGGSLDEELIAAEAAAQAKKVPLFKDEPKAAPKDRTAELEAMKRQYVENLKSQTTGGMLPEGIQRTDVNALKHRIAQMESQMAPPAMEMGTPGPAMASTDGAAGLGSAVGAKPVAGAAGEMGMATAATPGLGGDISGGMQSAFNKMKRGQELEAKALGEQGKAEAEILNRNMKQAEEQNQKFDLAFADLDAKRNTLQQDILNGKIDPNRLMGSLSTPQRVSTAIGLILGGMSSGITGKENPALKYLQSQIDADIDAQKAELGKKQTLLQANMQDFGNLKDARAMTKANMMDMLSLEMKQAAAKAQDPMAKARLLQEAGKVDLQAAQLIGPLKAKQQMLQAVRQGAVKPDQAINMVVEEKDRDEARKELAGIEKYNNTLTNINNLFGEAKKIGTVGASIPFTESRTKLKAINAQIMGAAREMARGQGALSDKEVEDVIKPFTLDASDRKDQIDIKLKALNNLMQSKMRPQTPYLKQYGIMPDIKANTMTAQEQKVYNWAQQNKDKPEAKAILQRLGGK